MVIFDDAVCFEKRTIIDFRHTVKDDINGMVQIKTPSARELPGMRQSQCTVVTVVPCFNEERRLDTRAFVDFVRRFPSVHFLFIDDGSTDGTCQRLRAMCDEQPDALSFVSLPGNRGKAEAVRYGLLHALHDEPSYIAFWDADLATPLDELLTLLCLAEENNAVRMVVGSRVRLLGRSIERKMLRHYVGRIFATLISLMLKLPLYDTQCGAKLLRVTPELPALLARPFLSRWLFDVELFVRIIAQASREHLKIQACIIEHPLHVWREQGKTKLHFLDVFRIPWDLLRIAWVIRKKHKE